MKINAEYNILFTSAGRRVELVNAFKEAADRASIKANIYGADITDTAPALYFCDKKFIVPRIKTAEYIPALLSLCKEEKVDLLIPTIDTDLLILSESKALFSEVGTRVLVAEPCMVKICRDKRLTGDFFRSCGLFAPDTFDDISKYTGGFPCFIKPKDGSSSIDAYRVDSFEELSFLSGHVSDYIIQPFIAGREYTIDVTCDFEGNPVYIVPRERLAVRSGEVLKTRIALDAQMIEEARAVVKKFKPCGAITLQLIRQTETGHDYFIEINPRLGGGAPLSMKAGAKAAEAWLRLLEGEKVGFENHNVADGKIYSRFDQSICVN